MDDVDRLFQCFKCGISPPQSAVREKRKEKRKLKQERSPQLQASTISEKKSVNSKTNGKQFSPVVFYGSPHGVPPKRPARLLRLLHEIRVDLAEQNKLRKEVWSTFPRQDEAMKFAKQHVNDRVFSYQDHMNGQRRFLVSTYKEFWQRYKEMNSKFRHHYEVIQEGRPCHLYFDLEFNKKGNIDRNGDEMVDLLIVVIFDAFLEKYSILGTEDYIVELDSSTEVIYVVDLRRAVYYQKCHDPDCQGYRSPLRPVPDDVIPDPALMFNLDGDNYSEEQTKPTVDGSFTDSCKKEWWHEAIKVAEQVEKIQKALDLTQMVSLTSLLDF
ncbi:UNVERIFIED_CONTAM: hypothetical protein Sindi_2062000 [Sesamum indicum]